MPAVDEHGELDARGTPDVHQGVKRRADGAAGEQDVVDEHDGLAVDVERDLGRVDLGAEIRREIIAVQADVQPAERNVHPLDRLDALREPLREQVAARDDADKGEVASPLVGLEDLMGDAREGSVDLLRVHADRFDVSAVVHAHPFRRMGADGSQHRGRQGSKPRTRMARCRIRAEKKPLRRTKACSWLAPFSRGCSEVSALSVSLYRI